MTFKKSRLVYVTSFLLLMCIVVFCSSEWNRAAFGSNGYIDSGSKFGVEVGSPFIDAERHLLSRGLVAYELEYNPSDSKVQKCHGHEYPSNVHLQAFDDDSWRRGIICVASENGKVIRVSWHYGMFQP